MPGYKVLEKGFFGGMTYDPEGKRKELHTDKPLDPVPSWLEPLPEETAKTRDTRLRKEKKQQKKNTDKNKQDDADVNALETL